MYAYSRETNNKSLTKYNKRDLKDNGPFGIGNTIIHYRWIISRRMFFDILLLVTKCLNDMYVIVYFCVVRT